MGTCQSSAQASHQRDRTKNEGETQVGGSSSAFLTGTANGGGDASQEVQQDTVHPILKEIETLQTKHGKPFGRILDAGTGLGSFTWLAHLLSRKEEFGVQQDNWVAVTASPVMVKAVAKEAQRLGVPDVEGHLILGNWFDGIPNESRDNDSSTKNENRALLLEGETFDTILVDYLIGAMDAFSPYLQDCIFDRLAHHLNPGGRIYLVGTEPIPDKDTNDAQKDLVCRVKRVRDVCILLTGDRCYREYPLSWTLRQMKRCGLNIESSQQYSLLHRRADLHDQIGVGRSMLKKIADPNLASSLEDTLDQLELEMQRKVVKNHQEQPIHLGFDYLVVAERKSND